MNDARLLISDKTVTCIHCREELIGQVAIIGFLQRSEGEKLLTRCDKCEKFFHLHKFYDAGWQTVRFFVDFSEAK